MNACQHVGKRSRGIGFEGGIVKLFSASEKESFKRVNARHLLLWDDFARSIGDGSQESVNEGEISAQIHEQHICVVVRAAHLHKTDEKMTCIFKRRSGICC